VADRANPDSCSGSSCSIVCKVVASFLLPFAAQLVFSARSIFLSESLQREIHAPVFLAERLRRVSEGFPLFPKKLLGAPSGPLVLDFFLERS